MIGDMDILLNNEKRRYCFMTKKGAELLTLSKKEFKKLIYVEYREIGAKVYQGAMKKSKTYKSHYKTAVHHWRRQKEKMKNSQTFNNPDLPVPPSLSPGSGSPKFQRKSISHMQYIEVAKDPAQNDEESGLALKQSIPLPKISDEKVIFLIKFQFFQ